MTFDRIRVDYRIMGGVPCIAGTRIPVATIVALIADGATADDIVADHPQLDAAAVREALQFAAEAVRERQVPLLRPSA